MNTERVGNTAPAVSIIVPLYNGARFIERTLDAVAAQSLVDYELIVIDDGSIDEGPSLVRARLPDDPRLALARNQHLGIAGTRNTGLRLISPSSRLVIFLDQDDLWRPEFLETVVGVLEGRPDAVGAFALADFVDADDVWAPGTFSAQMQDRKAVANGRLVQQPAGADLGIENVFLGNPVYPPSTLVVRREVLAELRGFSDRYRVADDWDLVIRLARRGPLVPVESVLAGYRRHGGNASGNTPRNIRETRLIWATAFHSAENSPEQVRALRRMWRLHQRRTARRKANGGLARVRAGAPVAGLRSLLDAAAHLMLRQPPRFWLRYGVHGADKAVGSATVAQPRFSEIIVERGS